MNALVSCTWEAEAGCSKVQGQPQLHQPGQLNDILSQNKIKTSYSVVFVVFGFLAYQQCYSYTINIVAPSTPSSQKKTMWLWAVTSYYQFQPKQSLIFLSLRTFHVSLFVLVFFYTAFLEVRPCMRTSSSWTSKTPLNRSTTFCLHTHMHAHRKEGREGGNLNLEGIFAKTKRKDYMMSVPCGIWKVKLLER